MDVRIPAADLEALQVDRLAVSLVVCDVEGEQVEVVQANTPVRLDAVVRVNSGNGASIGVCPGVKLTVGM